MPIPFLKPLERYIRKVLIRSRSTFTGSMISDASEAIPLSETPRILIIRPDKLGDMLITLPTIKAIRDAYPKARIDVLAGKVNLPLREQLLHYVDDCLLYDKTLAGIFGLYRSLPKNQYDIAIDPMDNPSTTSGFLIRMSKAKHTVGIYKSNAHVYTHCVVPKDRKHIHIVERTAQVLLALGVNPEAISLSIPYHLDTELIESSQRALLLAGVNLSKPLIMINIAGALDYRVLNPEKTISWIQSIQSTIEDQGIQIMVCGEKKHADSLKYISSHTNTLTAPFVDSYNAFAGLLAGSSMVISPDTSVLHLISAFTIPCLAFFVEDNSGTMVWKPYQSPCEYIVTKGPTVNDIPSHEIVNAFHALHSRTAYASVQEQYQHLQG